MDQTKPKGETCQCPWCEGRKKETVHLSTSSGGRWEHRDCSTCSGHGFIFREHAERIEAGNLRREDRKARLMTLRQEAERLGISPTELSKIENGRI